jgi:hypothetical protein
MGAEPNVEERASISVASNTSYPNCRAAPPIQSLVILTQSDWKSPAGKTSGCREVADKEFPANSGKIRVKDRGKEDATQG